ncbi:hypothetical protein BDZ45DRAFT_350132 [Acephala macrosclerotiorum]|nr:hypothetical protein BDZ45DRAFT_350132 [Acephala macrosclerotiorum]
MSASREHQTLSLKSLEAVVQCPSGNSSSSRAQQSARAPNGSRGGGRGGGSGRRGGKRTPGDRDFHNNTGGGDGNENDPKRSRSDPPQSPPIQKWFACHFHKHDPAYFSTNEATRMRYKTCGAGGWDDIYRLKEHLYRVHKDLPKCDKCQKEFKKPEQLKAHLREQTEGACQLQQEIPSKGISPEIFKELHKRPKHTMTDEERWFAIWRLLFPNEELPESPYSDVNETSEVHEVDTFHGYLEQRMSDHFVAKLDVSLDQVYLPEEVKKIVMGIVLEQEKSSRDELWKSYQHGPTIDGQLSEGSESYHSTGSISMANNQEYSELNQSSKVSYQQPTVSNELIANYHMANNFQHQSHQLRQPQEMLPATPSIYPQSPKPSTPVRQMSWSTHDSALGSDLQSSLDSENRYVDPANIMTTPKTHVPHSRTYNLPPAMKVNDKSEIPNVDQGNHSLSPPWSLSSPTPEAFDFSGIVSNGPYSDEDAPNSPENYTF